MERLVILGSGPAGCSAAIYAARAGLAPVILAGMQPGGLLTQTNHVENYPGFPDGTTGFDLTDAMARQAQRFGATLKYNAAIKIAFAERDNHITLEDGSELIAEAVVLALGSRHRLGLPDEKRFLGKGLSYCATCDGAFFRNQSVTVIGGGDMALEEALALTAFAAEVHLIHRRDTLSATKILADRVLANPKVIIHRNSLPTALEADDNGRVAGVRIQSTLTDETALVPCKGVFVAVGVLPNTELLEGTALPLDEQGYIKLVDGAQSLTALPGVFAAGDCADPRYRQAIVAAGMGAKAGMDAVNFLSETSPHSK